MGSEFRPPVQYLRECSDSSLRHFEVIKLEHVANLHRELRAGWEQVVEESALALLARWMIDNRAALRSRMCAVEPPRAIPRELPVSCFSAAASASSLQETSAAILLEPPVPAVPGAGPVLVNPAPDESPGSVMTPPEKDAHRRARFRRQSPRQADPEAP